jgi:hypothetical protein
MPAIGGILVPVTQFVIIGNIESGTHSVATFVQRKGIYTMITLMALIALIAFDLGFDGYRFRE